MISTNGGVLSVMGSFLQYLKKINLRNLYCIYPAISIPSKWLLLVLLPRPNGTQLLFKIDQLLFDSH